MSYDFWLEIDTGGPEPAQITDTHNYTSNVWLMFRKAMGGLPSLDGCIARNCIPLLRQAIERMEADPQAYRRLNPANGWGDYDGAVGYLRSIMYLCEQHPKATVRIWS